MKEKGKDMRMDMMRQMMGNMSGMPPMMEKCMEMCQSMSEGGADKGTAPLGATPEIQALFEEWVKNIEDDIVSLLKGRGSVTISAIATSLKISEESVLFFVGKMAREKQIKITGVSVD
jgi:hypothetical protein